MKSITAMIAFTCVAMVAPLALLAGTFATQSAIDYASNSGTKQTLMEEAHSIGHITVVSVDESVTV